MNLEDWNRYAFVVVCGAIIAKNLSLGPFQQVEELMLLSSKERGQTVGVAIGWPFEFLCTEAYTLNFH